MPTSLKRLILTKPGGAGGGIIKSHGQTEVPGSRASPISLRRWLRRVPHPAGPLPPEPGERCWLSMGEGTRPAPLTHMGDAGPGRSYLAAWAAPSPPRRGSGLAIAARPGLAGRVINSRPRRPLAPRPPHCQLPPTPDPGCPGPGAPIWPGLLPAGGGSVPRCPGGGERPPLPGPAWGGGGSSSVL